MKSTLPGVGTLINESVKLFQTTWNQSTRASMWFLYGALIQFALAIIDKLWPSVGLILSPLELVVAVIFIWTSVRLTQDMLILETGKSLDLSQEHIVARHAWNYVLPLIWLGILEGIIFIGGFLLLVIPFIFLAVDLAFAQFFLVEENIHGFKALTASHALVKGRWWPTCWRFLAGNIVFSFFIGFMTLGLMLLVSIVAGPEKFFAALGPTGQSADPLIQGVMSLVQGIMSAAFLPLTVAFHVKLYRALKASR